MAYDYDSLLALMKSRRSVRKLHCRPVERALLEQILEAARWAPSAGNRQAWRFVVVTDATLVGAMADAVEARTAELVQGARPDAAAGLSAYVRAFSHFREAPALIVTLGRAGPDLIAAAAQADPARDCRASTDVTASIAAATMNMLLAAHALGLGACWMTGPLVAHERLAELLTVPDGWAIASLIPVGYPVMADEPPPPRRSLDKIVRFL